MTTSDRVARMVLEADAWYEDAETGEYTVDCPNCGAPAPLTDVIEHGRCSAGVGDAEEQGELEDDPMADCDAVLWFSLGYTTDPSDAPVDPDA